jgi:hypothetical protein
MTVAFFVAIYNSDKLGVDKIYSSIKFGSFDELGIKNNT